MGKENAKKRNKKKNATIEIVNIEIEVQERGRDFSLFVLLKNLIFVNILRLDMGTACR